MTRILLRSPKDPFQVVSPRTVYHRNLIGNNSGNLVFLHAAHRLLATNDVEIDAAGLSIGPEQARMVNERYDAFVVPLANAFRPSFERHLKRMTKFIRRLRIPVVVLGVGAQSDAKYNFGRIGRIEESVRTFVSAVLDRSPSIGVRGELTAEYLWGLGFRDVEVIGCPSMFLHGDRLEVTKRTPVLEQDARVAMNVSPYVKPMGPIVMAHVDRYPNLTYIAQDLDTLGLLVTGRQVSNPPSDDPMPTHRAHPLFQQRRVRFYVEPWRWLDDLSTMDFSFGTRIHGNITSLMAGTPAYVFAHDSRTLELARYFEIPYRPMSDVPPDIDAAELYDEADFSGLVRNHPRRFATFASYLAKHGLRHVFEPGEDPAIFTARVAATPFPPALTVSRAVLRPGGLESRVEAMRHRAARAGLKVREGADRLSKGMRRKARRVMRR